MVIDSAREVVWRLVERGRSSAFLRYLLVGGASLALDVGLLLLMRQGLGAPIWLATTVAFSAVFFNFAMNARWVFRSDGHVGAMATKYALLVVLNYLVTLAMVVGLTHLGLFYLVAKGLAVVLCVVLNFFLYRHWVFAGGPPPDTESSAREQASRLV
jgi:putative flippase GtrA